MVLSGANRDRMVEDGRTKTALIVDSHDQFRQNLARELMAVGFQVLVACDAEVGGRMIAECAPVLVICEDDLHRPWLRLLRKIEEANSDAQVVVVTVYGSLSSAVRAVQSGAAGYFAKPVTARQILDFLTLEDDGPEDAREAQPTYRTLDRARWEYINLTLDVAGSIAEAARRLGVARRSLRRMLNRYPPLR